MMAVAAPDDSSPSGERVQALLASAQVEISILVPFIRAESISRLLTVCPEGLPIRVLGRFRPGDILAGASDLEAGHLLLDHPQVEFSTHPLLHAKLFRADVTCLVGSANATLRGLGWGNPNNLEILVEVSRTLELKTFEEAALRSSQPMTAVRLRELTAAVRGLAEEQVLPAGDLPSPEEEPAPWLPTCSTPRLIFDVYSGGDVTLMLSSALNAARHDLSHLEPPPGMDRAALEAYITAGLSTLTVVRKLRTAAEITHQEGMRWIQEYYSPASPPMGPDFMWEVLQKWLEYFFPDEFRQETTATKLVRGRIL